jgi:hypothetical protein
MIGHTSQADVGSRLNGADTSGKRDPLGVTVPGVENDQDVDVGHGLIITVNFQFPIPISQSVPGSCAAPLRVGGWELGLDLGTLGQVE